MSKYFRTLSRLQVQHQVGTPDLVLGGELTEPSDSAASDKDDLVLVDPYARLPLAKRQAALSHLLDHLRAVIHRSESAGVVISSVSGFEPLDPVLFGLARECQSQSLRLLVGEVFQADGGRLLRDHQGLTPSIGSHQLTAVSLSGRNPQAVHQEWLSGHRNQFDFVIVKAPPIAESADAILLAKGTGGLALVAQPFATTREALRTSIERARSAECSLLGLVMVEAKHSYPRWFRNLFGASRTAQEMRP